MGYRKASEEDLVDSVSGDSDSNFSSDDSKEHGTEEADVGQTKKTDEGDGNVWYKKILELKASDIMNMEFSTEQDAHEFYVKYAKCVGFAVRRDDVVRDAKGNIIRRNLVCSREGLRGKKHYMRVDRKREHRPVTRTNCGARLLVFLDSSRSRWKVMKFEEEHNHELAPAKFVHMIPNYRKLTEADKAQVDSMHSYGIRTCHIMGFMTGQAGGYAGLGFCKKDLYNYIDSQRRAKIADGDAFAAVSYLQAKADTDPMMFARYTTEKGRLGNLLWADGISRVDYQHFGDVLAFDTTYKKNKYDKPLVIFSGANHHRQTCVFACALVVDERVETYKWVLDAFLDAMQRKQPMAVVTDGDKAMRKAIKALFPNAHHRLCAWHLEKNAKSNIRNKEFLQGFRKCIYANFELDEFEEHWKCIVEEHGVSHNKWVKKTFKRRTMWATAYLRDKFFAGVRTTSRCEGINSFIKSYIKSRHSLVEFIHHFQRAVNDYRNNEMVADFRSMYGQPVLTSALDSIERAAANVYTREIFKEFKDELELAAALFVVGVETIATTVIYKINKFGKADRVYKLMYDRNSEEFDCHCRLWNTQGIPCCHIICVMRHEHIETLPKKLILRRWTKTAKCDDLSSMDESVDNDKMSLIRYGALCSASSWMNFLASKNLTDFVQTRDEISRITSKLESKCSISSMGSSSISNNFIGDPVMVKTKGAPPAHKKTRKRRRCSNCNMPGHTIRKCANLQGFQTQPSGDAVNNSSTSDEAADQVHGSSDKTVIGSSPSIIGSQVLRPIVSVTDTSVKAKLNHDIDQSQPCYPCPPTVGSQRYYGAAQVSHNFLPPSTQKVYLAGAVPAPQVYVADTRKEQYVAPPATTQMQYLSPLGLTQQQYLPIFGQQWYPQNQHQLMLAQQHLVPLHEYQHLGAQQNLASASNHGDIRRD